MGIEGALLLQPGGTAVGTHCFRHVHPGVALARAAAGACALSYGEQWCLVRPKCAGGEERGVDVTVIAGIRDSLKTQPLVERSGSVFTILRRPL